MSSSGGRLLRLLVLSIASLAVLPSWVYGDSLQKRLLGTWTLVSLTRVVGDVEEPGMLGREAVGRIIFAPDGHFCVNAMRSPRSQFGSRDFQGGTPEEKTAAYDSYSGYCGRYEVNEQEHSVVFRLEVSSYPNWTGTTQKRFMDVAGNRLKLTTPPILSQGRQIVGVAVWERAQ